MYNRSERTAWGGCTYVAYHEEVRLGLKLRYRRWMNRGWSFNVGGGPILVLADGGLGGGTGSVDLSYKDWVAAYVGLDVYDAPEEADLDGRDWYIGAKLGSWPGAALNGAAALSPLAILAVYLLVCATGGCE
jgi:hypothetical protein